MGSDGVGVGVVRISDSSCPPFTGIQGLAECSPDRKGGGYGHMGWQHLVEGCRPEAQCIPGGAGTQSRAGSWAAGCS